MSSRCRRHRAQQAGSVARSGASRPEPPGGARPRSARPWTAGHGLGARGSRLKTAEPSGSRAARASIESRHSPAPRGAGRSPCRSPLGDSAVAGSSRGTRGAGSARSGDQAEPGTAAAASARSSSSSKWSSSPPRRHARRARGELPAGGDGLPEGIGARDRPGSSLDRASDHPRGGPRNRPVTASFNRIRLVHETPAGHLRFVVMRRSNMTQSINTREGKASGISEIISRYR